ncbi:hypothetical protein MPTK1_3g04220 [Marchantia polymorpha subsp. ruderalis]|uniref:Transcription factor TFIIB cyclin-like domain-containing protein n=2 Tax=Marchantia polymorpha TaxID=3197 RepID=A0AAF6AXB2_MARPO|nr:hypothetical protein MARPO_0022s0109 [Marchantia polymorpha]BBN04396.1 hypothetical protein Mp_3g04220 [Marchantia polymorpha subsp. ruderalis]|eukprot:PTQ44008.1 hypothetical protein MARPO_0022s0109 [Marchantia polymorpha]
MDVRTGERCQSCGEASMVMDAVYGIYACEACGSMGDQAATQLGSEFQLGHVIERRGTNIGEHDSGAAAAKGLMRGQMNHNFYTGFTSWSERHKLETLRKVQRISGQLRVPGDKVDEVKHLLERTVDGDWGAGRWVDVLVAACVYIVIRQSQLPLTIPEVADCVNCDVVELGRMYNRVLQKLNISVPHVDLSIFLERALSTLPALTKQSRDTLRIVARQGKMLLTNAVQWFITTGRRPLPVTAAVLQLVLEANKISVHISDVARQLYAGIGATRMRYKECKNSLVVIAQKLPWGADITPKTVLRHLPFIIQYLELKHKLQKGANQGSTCIGQVVPRKRASTLLCGKSDSLLLNAKNTLALNGHRQTSTVNQEKVDGRPAKFLTVSRAHFHSVQKSELVEVKLDDEDETFPRDDCRGDRPDMRRKTSEDLPDIRAPESTTGAPVPERNGSANVLPVAFVASEEARKRRLHKIHLAKLRIFQRRALMSQTYGVSQQLSVPPSPVHIQEKPGYVRRVDDIYLAPDIEDLRIEKLLLKGASGADLETGYYRSLEAQFLEVHDGDCDKDFTEYVHSSCEVEYLKELKKLKTECSRNIG